MARIDYKPIPCPDDKGHIALNIYPPGEFIGNKGWDVFVGGCGVGEKPTLESAERFLFTRAIQQLERRMERARQENLYYTEQRDSLYEHGLERLEKS